MFNSAGHNSNCQDKKDTQQEIIEKSMLLTWDIPVWEKELQDITVQEREKGVELVCICRGLSDPSAKWFHKGREVFSDFHMKLKQEGGTATLVIKSIREQDSGRFKCVMTAENGELETSCALSIKATEIVEPPVFVKELHDTEVEEGEKLELDVEVRGTPPIGVFWYHNNVEITHDSPHFLMASLGHIHTLTILHATSESSGEYVCEAYSDFGDTDTFCFVDVREVEHPESPEFVTCPLTLTAQEGETVNFTCQVKGHPIPTVLWERGGVVIATTQKYKITKIQDQHMLTVYNTDETDVGEYICHLHSTEGDLSHAFALHVICESRSGEPEAAETVKSRSGHIQGLTLQADMKSYVRGDNLSASPQLSRRFKHQQMKDTSKHVEERTNTSTSYKTSFETRLETTGTTINQPSTVPQTAHSDQQKPHLDYDSHNNKYVNKQSTSHLTESLLHDDSGIGLNPPETKITCHSVLTKSLKTSKMINSDVTDFRSVLKHRERSHPSLLEKPATSQSPEVDCRKVLTGDKVKQQTEPVRNYVSVSIPAAQTSHTMLSQNVEFTSLSHSTSSTVSSTNHSQSPINLADQRIGATVSDKELMSAQKNFGSFRHVEALSASPVQYTLTGGQGYRRSRNNPAYSPSSSQHSDKSSNEQTIRVTPDIKYIKDSSNTEENKQQYITISGNHSITKGKQQGSQDMLVSYTTGENSADDIREKNQSETKMGEKLFKSEVQIIEKRTSDENGCVKKIFPQAEQSFSTSINTRIIPALSQARSASAPSQVRSESYLTDRDVLDLESEKWTLTSESQKENTVQSRKVSVIHFSPQMSSVQLKPEELKLEVTSVSVSIPLRSSVSSPLLHSQSLSSTLSDDLPEKSVKSTYKHEDVDDVFSNLTEERISAYSEQNSSLDEYNSTLQSFGPIFTWEKAPWDLKEDTACAISPQDKLKRNVIENLNTKSTTSLSENITSHDNSHHWEGKSASEFPAYSKLKTTSDSDVAISSEVSRLSKSAVESRGGNISTVRLKHVTSKGKPDLIRSKFLSASTECVFAEIKLKPVAKTDDRWRRSQLSLSAGRVKDKPKSRDLSNLFTSSSQDIFQKNIHTSNGAKVTSVKLSNNIESSKTDTKFMSQPVHSKNEKPNQSRKIKTADEKHVKASLANVSRTIANSKSKGIGAKFEASIKDSKSSGRNIPYTSPSVTKNSFTEIHPSKTLITSDNSGRILGRIQHWKSVETPSSVNIDKKMLGAIGKSNSNNALLESGSKSCLDKDQEKMGQKRHSLQMTMAPSLPISSIKNVQQTEINERIYNISHDLEKTKENLQATGLNQTSDFVKKREIFETGIIKEQQNMKQADSRPVNAADLYGNNTIQADLRIEKAGNSQDNNLKHADSTHVKVDISQDESVKHKDSRSVNVDISEDRYGNPETRTQKAKSYQNKIIRKTYYRTENANVFQDKNVNYDSRTEKADICQDKNVEKTYSRTKKADISQDNSVQINRDELSLRDKRLSRAFPNEHNAKPEWINRQPVSNIEAKIKGHNTAVSQSDRTKPEWVSLRQSKNKDSELAIKNKNVHELNTNYTNMNKDEPATNITAVGDAYLKLFQTDVSMSHLKQSGSCDSGEFSVEDKSLFSEKSLKPKPVSDVAATKDLCKVQTVIISNKDTIIQAAAVTVVSFTAKCDLPIVKVGASANLASTVATAATVNTVTNRFVGKDDNSVIPKPADVTPVPAVTNRNAWEASTRRSDITVDQSERIKVLNETVISSQSRASNVLRKEFQGNNFNRTSSKLFVQSSTESAVDDQHSHSKTVVPSWVTHKHHRSGPVHPAHGTGLSLHSEHLTSSMDDSESVLSTTSISSSSSDASNVTIDSGYPRNSSRCFVDNEKRGPLSEVLHHENSGRYTIVNHSKSFEDEVSEAKACKIKDNILEVSETKKKYEVALHPRNKDRNIQIITRDQKYNSGFVEEIQDKKSNFEAAEGKPRSGISAEKLNFRVNKSLDELEQARFQGRNVMGDNIIQAQENLTQDSKESENFTSMRETEDVADLTKDFGTTRKYSKKRRKHPQIDKNDVITEISNNMPTTRLEPGQVKSRFSYQLRKNETDNKVMKSVSVASLERNKETVTHFNSEDSEFQTSRKSRFRQNESSSTVTMNKTTVIVDTTHNYKPSAVRPSDLNLSHHSNSSGKEFISSRQNRENKQTASASATEITTTYSLPPEQQQQLSPPSFPLPLQDTGVMYGSRTVLHCQVIGNPRPEVKWLLNQKQIEPSKNITILYTDDKAQLEVGETFAEHVGDYTCWARNSLGTVSSHCTLILEASNKTESRALEGPVFSPPKIVSLIPSVVSIVQGSPLTLTVTFVGEPSPSVRWMLGDRELLSGSHAHIVTTYNTSCLTIKSVNQSDAGKMSVCLTSCTGTDQATTNICIEDVPGTPVGRPHVYEITKSSASLSWYAPSSNDGNQVTYYIIEAKTRQDNTWDVIVPHCKDVSCHILGLKPCTTYQFRVLAANKHGVSAPSEPSERVLTSDPFTSPSDYESEAYADVFTPSVEFQIQDDFPFEPREVQINTAEKFEDIYELDKEVGKGKFGIVFKCKHKTDGTVWAAKIVKCRERDKGVIRREIDIMNKLRHPKLLLLWDAYESPKQMVLVMEYIGAGELFERVIGEDFVLTEGDCIHFMRQICEGVNYMHSSNILHLDLKPENILCLAENSNRIKIIDFGLAQFYKPGQSNKVLFGTPEFIAPEVINYDDIGFVTDMWSIGVISYVLLSGLSPFLGDSDAETLANVTSGEFDFDDEAFDEISNEAKHFISSLLVMKKEQRLLTDQCMAHVWLNQSEAGRVRSRRLNTERLKRFMVRRKWLKTGNAVLAVSRLLKSSNLSGLTFNGNSASDSILNTSQLSDKPLNSTLLKNPEDVVDSTTLSVENCITHYPDRDLDHASEYLSEIGKDKIINVKENSALSEYLGDLSATSELSSNQCSSTISEETLTQTTESSVSVVQVAGVILTEENQTSCNTDQNDNQVMNESSSIVTTSGTDLNHNMKPATSEAFTDSKYSDTLAPSITSSQVREDITDNGTEISQNLMSSDCDRALLQAPVFTKSMVNSNACVGDVARFDVIILGEPFPCVTWYFEDEEITPDSRHTLDCNEKTRSFSLIIRSIEEEDEGEYSCKAINSQGESVCVAELSVLDM